MFSSPRKGRKKERKKKCCPIRVLGRRGWLMGALPRRKVVPTDSNRRPKGGLGAKRRPSRVKGRGRTCSFAFPPFPSNRSHRICKPRGSTITRDCDKIIGGGTSCARRKRKRAANERKGEKGKEKRGNGGSNDLLGRDNYPSETKRLHAFGYLDEANRDSTRDSMLASL